MQDGVTVALVQFLDALRIFEVLSSGDLEILIFIIFDPTFFSFCTCLVQICRKFWDGYDARSTRGAWSTSGMLYIPRKADQSLLEWRSVRSMAAGIRYRCPRSLGNSTNSSKSFGVVMDLHFATFCFPIFLHILIYKFHQVPLILSILYLLPYFDIDLNFDNI